MLSMHPHDRETAGSAYELQRAAANFRRSVRDPDAVSTLPTTLAHVSDAIDELATSMLVLAHTVGDYANPPDTRLDDDALFPEARALRWHLHELASRLRASQRACPSARRWADDVLAKHPAEGSAERNAARS